MKYKLTNSFIHALNETDDGNTELIICSLDENHEVTVIQGLLITIFRNLIEKEEDIDTVVKNLIRELSEDISHDGLKSKVLEFTNDLLAKKIIEAT